MADIFHPGAFAPPIDRLPPETLRSIFLLLLHTKGARGTLIATCRRWREIMNNIALFWINIELNSLDMSVKGTEIDEHVWERFAARTGLLHLDISWAVSLISQTKIYDKCFKNLLSVAPFHRWRSLRLINMGPLRPTLVKGDFENLSTLEVDTRFYEYYNENGRAENLLHLIQQTAHRLKELTIVAPYGGYKTPLFHLLEALLPRLSRISFVNVDIKLLNGLPPNIQRLRLYQWPDRNRNYPHITYLTVKYLYSYLSSDIFPNLKILHFGRFQGPSEQRNPAKFPKLHTIFHDDFRNQFGSLKIIAPLCVNFICTETQPPPKLNLPPGLTLEIPLPVV